MKFDVSAEDLPRFCVTVTGPGGEANLLDVVGRRDFETNA